MALGNPGPVFCELGERATRHALELPSPPRALGSYEAVVIRGTTGVVSGQFPFSGGKLVASGRIGIECDLALSQHAARAAALNCCAQIASALDARSMNLSRLVGLLRLEGLLVAAPGTTWMPQVLDAASEVFIALLGPGRGLHARSLAVISSLPGESPLELVVSFSVC